MVALEQNVEKIPIPITFGKRIFEKRMNGYIDKKLTTPMNSNLSITNNNSISNSSVSKHFIFNKNNSSSKNIKKDEFNKNNKY